MRRLPPKARNRLLAEAAQAAAQRAASPPAEWQRCAADPLYFITTYVHIYDATAREWIPFDLWPAQRETLDAIIAHRLTIILKARQLGLTWLVLGYALWLILFHAAAAVTLFSRRDDEAVYLLGMERLRGMYARLPEFLKRETTLKGNDHQWHLSNGSIVRAFPTTAGDSYTVTLAIVDEADLSPDLGALLSAAKPTIDGGGQMILLSRTDKSAPNSEFKRIYRAAKSGDSPWHPIFLPWNVRPERDAAWYDEQRRDILSRTGALDDLHEQYPATETESLAPRTLDKRISADWIERCYQERAPLDAGPALSGLTVWRAPSVGRRYVIGGDPAEGNPTSDDSAATVLDADSGEQVAQLHGKLQPSSFAAAIDALGQWYGGARVLIERNNHGHAVLLWLGMYSSLPIAVGRDGRPGWLSNRLGKTLLYDAVADAVRDRQTTICSFETYLQLASIDGSTLRAPEGELDDLADSYALALVCATLATTSDADEATDDAGDGLRISEY